MTDLSAKPPEPIDASQPSRPLEWHKLVLIAVLAFLIRLIYLWEISRSPFWKLLLGDGTAYDKWARQLAAGDWIGKEVFYQAPLYPYFLGVLYTIFHPSIVLVRFVQIGLGAASCALIAIAGARVFGRRAGLIAGLLLAVYPTAVFFDGIVQKSALDLFFMCALLAIVTTALSSARAGNPLWSVAGVVLGALILTRENAVILLGVMPAWLLVFVRDQPIRVRVIWSICLLVGAACVLLPVAYRNQAVGGEFHLTTSQFGPNFYIGNNAGADGTYSPLRFGRGDAVFERKDATDIAEAAMGLKLSPGEVSSYWVKRTMADIRESPARWLKLMWRKWMLTWNGLEIGDTEDIYTYAHWSWLLRGWGSLFHFGTLAPIGAVGVLLTAPALWRTLRKKTAGPDGGSVSHDAAGVALIHLLLWSLAASIVAFYLFGRYRYPLTPMLILLAAAAISWGIDTWRRGGRAAAGAAVLFAGVAAVLSNVELLPKDLMIAATYRNLGFAIANQKMANPNDKSNLDQALVYLRKSDAMTPDNPMVLNNLGGALARRGNTDEAITYFERAIKLKPDFAFAHFNLATALVDPKQNYEAAMHHLVEAEKFDPTNPAIPQKMGDALLGMKRVNDAIAAYRRALALDPKYRDAHNSIGLIYARGGDMENAAKSFAKAVEVAPFDADLRENLGRTLLALRQFDRAVEEFTVELRLAPGRQVAKVYLGQALAGAGRWREAGIVMAQVVQSPDAQAEDFALLALAAEKQDNMSQAIAAAERGVALARQTGKEALAVSLEKDLARYRAGADH